MIKYFITKITNCDNKLRYDNNIQKLCLSHLCIYPRTKSSHTLSRLKIFAEIYVIEINYGVLKVVQIIVISIV